MPSGHLVERARALAGTDVLRGDALRAADTRAERRRQLALPLLPLVVPAPASLPPLRADTPPERPARPPRPRSRFRQRELAWTRKRPEPTLAPAGAPVPEGGALLVCVEVPDPRRKGQLRRRLRRVQDLDQVGALNVAGPSCRVVGTRYLAQRLKAVEATPLRAAYWVASAVQQLLREEVEPSK